MTVESQLEAKLRALAAALDYPPTPDLATRLGRSPLRPADRAKRSRTASRGVTAAPKRRLAWAVLAALLVLAAAFAVPPVRAALVEVLGLGAVQIRLGEPTPSVATLPVTLPGETTLQAAQAASAVHIPIPTALGDPDRVFLLTEFGNTVVLVWEREAAALYVIPMGPLVQKLSPEDVLPATVAGEQALWAARDHFMQLLAGESELRMFVTSRVLIWETEGVTYRLETDRTLQEAIEIAESLQ